MSVTKNDVVLEIAKKTAIEQQKVKQIVQMTLDRIIEILAVEGRVEFRNFGVFEVKTRRPRRARNPKTGEAVMVGKKKVVAFRAGKIMDERVDHLMEKAPPKEQVALPSRRPRRVGAP